jgi:glycosyltransferase involved in cell wall biosynthesis
VRILHLISSAGPHPYFELLGAHSDRSRFDVRLATVGSAGALQEDAARMALPTFALGADRRSGYPRAILQLARRLRRERIEVIQTHLLDGCFVGLAAARLARTPVAIFTAHHSHEIPLQGRRLLATVDRLCAGPLCDAIVAPSAQMRDTLVRVHRVPPKKITVAHHGFELDRLDPAAAHGDAVRGELGLDGRTVLTAIGRTYWIKNQEALIQAFARVAPAAPEATLVLAGPGDPESLRALGESLGIGDRMRCLGPRTDVVDLLAATDLFVHPARAESFAMVIVEAMAMTCPVVATPVGIAPEVVVDGRTGILSESSEPEGLARALERALAVRDRWGAMGEEARRAAARFPAAGMVRGYEDLYERLLRDR